VFRIGEDIDNIAFGQALAQQLIDDGKAVGFRLFRQPVQHGFPIFDAKRGVAWADRYYACVLIG
jgi:hypothetical protein